jgi:hypothetical protein
MLFLSVRGFLDYAGPTVHSRLAWLPCCLPPTRNEVGILIYGLFAAQSPRPPIPLSTLQAIPRDIACKTRGQDGFATLLSRRALSSPTTCRFIPALSGLPVIREEFSKRVPLDLPVPDFWAGFGVPQSGAKRLNGIWGSQIRVCRIPIRASIQQASAGILDGCAKLRSADRRGTGGNSAGPSLQPSSRLKEPARDFR